VLVLANHMRRHSVHALMLAAASVASLGLPQTTTAEDRTITGTGNNLANPTRGSAGTAFIRLGYPEDYPDGTGNSIVSDAQRANARTISNTLGVQTGSVPNNRNLSSYLWMWGQFITHDIDLASTSNGSATNGTANIAVSSGDVLAPGPIPMTRSNFVMQGGARQQVNAITTWIDASMVYGSDAARAAALRTNGGTGAKLVTSAGNLPGFNTGTFANDNPLGLPANSLFLCGDVRANENVGLTAMHTLFVREHNRLVDVISAQQPSLTNEQKYQLARKIVGAEMQIITYKEFLPALLGTANAPTVQGYSYNPQENASITQSFAVAAFRFGHSALNSQLPRVGNDGVSSTPLALRDAFFNPSLLASNPSMVETILKGGATQQAEEIDTLFVDDVRNFLFGPPGAGGMDLAALNIQRGRDHGLADYRQLRGAYNLSQPSSFAQIPTTAALRTALQNLYGSINNIDGYIGGLAENHLAGSSVGALFNNIIVSQFERLRDGDRLFYTSNAAGLYNNGVLLPSIASIINLDTIRFADILALNTGLNSLQVQGNVFFAQVPGDFNGSGAVNATDIDLLFAATPGTPPAADLKFDINADGVVTIGVNTAGSDTDHLVRNILLTEYGDANLDRSVNISDFSLLASQFNHAGTWSQGNFNGDALVNIADFSLLAAKFNTTTAARGEVPEPALMAAPLALGALSRRRRRCA